MKGYTVVLLCTLAYGNAAQAQTSADVHIWFRSFIPESHEELPDYFLLTEKGTRVVRAPEIWPLYPSLAGTCFSTDDRGFEEPPTASSRTAAEFILEIRGREMTVRPPPGGRKMFRTGETRNVDCESGEDLQQPRKAATDSMSMGNVKKGGFFRTVFVEVAASDPFYTGIPAPSVDFNMSIRYEFLKKRIVINGVMDNFPAFEGYYRLDDGSIDKLVTIGPEFETTALSLFDLYLGINQRNYEAEIALP